MAMISKCFAHTLSFLKQLETDYCGLEVRVKAQIQTLRLKASFLKAFFSCKGKWQIDDQNLIVLLWHIQTVILSADKDIQELWSELNQISSKEYQRIPGNSYGLISSALLKVELINPDIQDVYAIVSKSTRMTCSTTDAVVESVDALLENLKDLLRCKGHSVIPVKEEIKALEENLKYLRDFLGVAKNWCTDQDNLKDLLTHAEAVADNTACLLYLCSEDSKMDEDMANEMKEELCHQLQKIKLNQPDVGEIYLNALQAMKSSIQSTFPVDEHVLGFLDSLLNNMIELSTTTASSLISLINPIEALHVELKILRFYLMDPSAQQYSNNHPKVNNLFLQIKVVVCKAAFVIYSSYNNGITRDKGKQLDLAITGLLQECKVIKEEAKDIYDELIPKSLRSNFPKTNELAFIDFVIQNMKELLNSKDDSIAQLRYQIETVHGNILSLRGDITEVTEQPREHKELKDPWLRFKDIVYQTDNVIDLFILRDEPLWYHKLGLFDIIEEIKNLKREVSDIKEKMITDTAVLKVSLNLEGVSSEANSTKFDLFPGPRYEATSEAKKPLDYVELYEDEAKQITEELTHGLKQLSIISIVGMPGIGKTTLADSIYESSFVPLYFHVYARCCVTQAYQKRRLLLEILQKVSRNDKKIHEMSDDDLAQKLYKSLKGKRYLIFFDDLWDIRLWNDLSACFQNENNGSRIMFTSRFQSIALQIESRSIICPLNPIPDDKCWKLLQVKLFQNESCPQELLVVGQQIAARCKGLPLAVDLVVGLLRNTESRADCWKQIVYSLSTHLLEDQQGRCMGILELSYNHLPNHLKPCFLYFRAFPEDKEVLASELMWLWIAEGFVQLQKDDKGSLEDVAEKYLSDLISRSLVIESRIASLGGVKASRVHDLLRDFALAKAKEECFLHEINGHGEHVTSSSCANTMYEPYRLCVYSIWQNAKAISKPSALRVRSLVLSRSAGSLPAAKVPFPLNNYKLLRILDLWVIKGAYCPIIFQLVHLRFLSLHSYSERIPLEIGNLQNLETFLLRMSPFREVELPETIWNLERLRHFKIWGSYTFPRYSLEKPFKLEHLQTVSTPSLSYGEETEKILRGLPNLRKLSCTFQDSWDDSSNCNRFPILDFLTRLTSLKLDYSGEVQQSCEFNFPPNVKKLTLSKFFLPWSEISTIGRLPNLEVLKLLSGAFEGKTWDMTDGEFLKLKFLKLENINIAQWNATEDHLPSLETLVLINCNGLEEIPSSLGDIITLQRLELHDCRRSVGISAGIIKEKQEEIGNQQFVVTIK